MQQIFAEKRLRFGKVFGKVNPADLYTKYVDWATIERHLGKLRSEFTIGRAEEAPKLHSVSMSIDEYNFMGLRKPWEWLDVITEAVKHESAKPSRSLNQRMCKGEINVLCKHGGSLEQSVLHGYTRQVQGSNGSNPAQTDRPWGSTQIFPSEHNRVQYPCSDGHVKDVGHCSHAQG